MTLIKKNKKNRGRGHKGCLAQNRIIYGVEANLQFLLLSSAHKQLCILRQTQIHI